MKSSIFWNSIPCSLLKDYVTLYLRKYNSLFQKLLTEWLVAFWRNKFVMGTFVNNWSIYDGGSDFRCWHSLFFLSYKLLGGPGALFLCRTARSKSATTFSKIQTFFQQSFWTVWANLFPLHLLTNWIPATVSHETSESCCHMIKHASSHQCCLMP
jgi:hypothetical protein